MVMMIFCNVYKTERGQRVSRDINKEGGDLLQRGEACPMFFSFFAPTQLWSEIKLNCGVDASEIKAVQIRAEHWTVGLLKV